MRTAGRYQRTRPVQIIQAASGSGERRVRLRLECPTPGASIGYTTDSGPDAQWLLYSEEVELSTPCQLRPRRSVTDSSRVWNLSPNWTEHLQGP